jgi:hypothetical protein
MLLLLLIRLFLALNALLKVSFRVRVSFFPSLPLFCVFLFSYLTIIRMPKIRIELKLKFPFIPSACCMDFVTLLRIYCLVVLAVLIM